MKVLLGIAQCYLPEVVGGAQSSTHQLALFLKDAGYDVLVASKLTGKGWVGTLSRLKLKLGRSPAVRDTQEGYPVYRGWDIEPVVMSVTLLEKPDVVILPTSFAVPVAKLLNQAGIPVIIYLRDVEFHELGGDLNELCGVRYIANSSFTAASYKARFGINAVVVPPLFKADSYITQTSRELVTFINPHPNKGADIVLAVAKLCPDIPFQIISGWVLPIDVQARLEATVATLPNVKLMPKTHDMRKVYAQTKVLMAPSQWEEAWGRVASEAQFSGIPVIGSLCGGLAEAIGPGGILLEKSDPAEAWAAALRGLWDNAETYERLSSLASLYSARDEINPSMQLKSVIKVIEDAVGCDVNRSGTGA